MIFRDWSVAGDGDQELGITRLHTSPAGALVWLERTLSGSSLYPGPHGASLRLMCLDTLGGEVREVVSHQQPEFTTEATAPFCGLFNPSLALRCWLGDSVLALSGPQGETLRPTFINLESGEVTNGNTASGHVTQSSPLIGCSRDAAGISSLPRTDPATLLAASFKVK